MRSLNNFLFRWIIWNTVDREKLTGVKSLVIHWSDSRFNGFSSFKSVDQRKKRISNGRNNGRCTIMQNIKWFTNTHAYIFVQSSTMYVMYHLCTYDPHRVSADHEVRSPFIRKRHQFKEIRSDSGISSVLWVWQSENLTTTKSNHSEIQQATSVCSKTPEFTRTEKILVIFTDLRILFFGIYSSWYRFSWYYSL